MKKKPILTDDEAEQMIEQHPELVEPGQSPRDTLEALWLVECEFEALMGLDKLEE